MISDIKSKTKEVLKNNWGISVCATLLYMFIAGILSVPTALTQTNNTSYLGFIIFIMQQIVILIAQIGLSAFFIQLAKNEGAVIENVLSGFQNIKRNTTLAILQLLICTILLALPVVAMTLIAFLALYVLLVSFSSVCILLILLILLLSIVIFLPLAYALKLVPFIASEYENLSSWEVIRLSISLMKKNFTKFFILDLSFMGWLILSLLSLGLGFLLFVPYYMTATAVLYLDINYELSTDTQKDELYQMPVYEENAEYERDYSVEIMPDYENSVYENSNFEKNSFEKNVKDFYNAQDKVSTEIVCEKCGNSNPPMASYCNKCGSKLES